MMPYTTTCDYSLVPLLILTLIAKFRVHLVSLEHQETQAELEMLVPQEMLAQEEAEERLVSVD